MVLREFGLTWELWILVLPELIKLPYLDKQKRTFIYRENNVVVKQNRDIEFSGWINAGKAEINATSALYNYEANKINLIKTNVTIFRVKPRKAEHGTAGLAMNSKINGVAGDTLWLTLQTIVLEIKKMQLQPIYPVFSVKTQPKFITILQNCTKEHTTAHVFIIRSNHLYWTAPTILTISHGA
ncbi:MAG: hypothetical protein R2779_09120 [Crocinitomicaceae bacterium]